MTGDGGVNAIRERAAPDSDAHIMEAYPHSWLRQEVLRLRAERRTLLTAIDATRNVETAVKSLCTALALMDRKGKELPEEIRQQCDALRKAASTRSGTP